MYFRSAIILLIGLLGASLKCAADTVDIREWLVPWEKSEPTDAWVGTRGRVWFVASEGDFIANFSQQTAEFNRYDLPRGTAPVALLPVPTRNSTMNSAFSAATIHRTDSSPSGRCQAAKTAGRLAWPSIAMTESGLSKLAAHPIGWSVLTPAWAHF
jgi:hypothetical protein